MKTAAHRQTMWTLTPAKTTRSASPKQYKVRRLTKNPLLVTSKNQSSVHSCSNKKIHHYDTPSSNILKDSISGQSIPPSNLTPEDMLSSVANPTQTQRANRISRSIEAHAPLWTVYDTWTRFEAFPHFMKGINDSHGLLNESRMVWRIRTGENHVPLEAEICAQIPFQKIAWQSVTGHPHPNSGEVTFEAVNNEVTHITAHFDFDLSGANDWPGDPIPAVTQCLDWSLQCFCSVVESHVDPECESFACPKAAVA